MYQHGAQESLVEALISPQYNVGKDVYTVDLENNEKLYWLGTESGLLGSFGFEGACTVGDVSCDPPTRSMGMGFCNFSVMHWNTTTPLPHVFLQEQRIRESSNSESSLQTIHKWIDGGVKLNLSKSSDTDVLRLILLKLQRRVEAWATTLLIKVKVHRGDPLNEESEIWSELHRLKEYKETIWNDSSDRTVHQ